MSATKQDYSCLCEGRLPKLSSLDLEWAAPLTFCPSAFILSTGNDYLAVLRDKRNKTQRENSSCLVAVTQCSISFQTIGLISSLFLLCLLLRFLSDSSLRLQGNQGQGYGYFFIFFVAIFLLSTKRRRCSSHVLSALACIQGAK